VAKPKVILQLYPVIPAEGATADEQFAYRSANKPMGADNEAYHRILHEWTDVVKAADQIGAWGVSTIEHHFHSEGYELGPNPGILNAYWASQVDCRVGAIGYVMATQDPIRVAEETAILDHLTKGKYFVGFARGYQARWANVLGQFSDSVATLSDGGAGDARNRDIFEERVEMVLKFWTEESSRVQGDFYQVPYPYEEGISGYPAAPTADAAGVPGEVSADGNIQRVAVLPKPYQKPYPPCFVAAMKSLQTISFCAEHGFIPSYFMKDADMADCFDLYVEEGRKHGKHYVPGQNQNVVRWCHVTDDKAAFERKLLAYDLDIYTNFYGPFFPQLPTGDEATRIQGIKDSGLFLGGSVDDCIREWQETYRKAPAEYITLIYHWAQQPKDDMLEEFDRFVNKVVPELEAPELSEAAE
jgi:alkanesulfonate monooxygenase SsuD/methylene tetrahydromethanopterin reductase-like flavin-dependent oxidoreductase (luciferase family)